MLLPPKGFMLEKEPHCLLGSRASQHIEEKRENLPVLGIEK
jgi:hypothetical protein